MGYRILFVIHKISYGGAEKIIAFLANKFSLDGNDVYLLTYEDMTLMQNLVAQVKHIGLLHPVPSIFVIRRISQIIQMRELINKIDPDALIAFLPYPNIISILASKGSHIPVIISQRCDPSTASNWFTKFRDFIYNFADGYVFQTNEAKGYYNDKIQAKAIVIPNPVVADNIPAMWTGDRENIIVHVGRFELEQKRQDVLIRAFSKIACKYRDIKLVLYGDGEDEAKIKAVIAECKLEGRVVLGGVTKNVYESIKKAKLFVLSSDYEGLPNALIEAMCVGAPCISTDCFPSGSTGLIKNMENGLLVKAGCIDELAHAMEFMLDNPQIAETMGQNALRVRSDLNSEVIFGQWKEYIENQISMRSPKSKND